MADRVGRPLKFKSVESLQAQIDYYFKSCHSDAGDIIRPYTITGLALALDTTRHTLLNYGKDEEYLSTIKKAKQKIENYAEESLYTNKHTAGIIFNLKNNYGWVDKQEVAHSGSLTIEGLLDTLDTDD